MTGAVEVQVEKCLYVVPMSEVDFFDGMVVVVKFFEVLHILLEDGHVSCQMTANIEDIMGLFESVEGDFGDRGENCPGADLS